MNNFNDVENAQLRSYNRATMAMNLAEDKGEDEVRAYFGQFDEKERAAILLMLAAIRHNPEETKRLVLNENSI